MQSHAIKATTRPEKRLESFLLEHCMQGKKKCLVHVDEMLPSKNVQKTGDSNNKVLNTRCPLLHS